MVTTSQAPPEPPAEPTSAPWPPPWARAVGFFVGIGLIIFEAAIEHSAHFYVYGIGIILTGLPIARGADRFFDLISGRKP